MTLQIVRALRKLVKPEPHVPMNLIPLARAFVCVVRELRGGRRNERRDERSGDRRAATKATRDRGERRPRDGSP